MSIFIEQALLFAVIAESTYTIIIASTICNSTGLKLENVLKKGGTPLSLWLIPLTMILGIFKSIDIYGPLGLTKGNSVDGLVYIAYQALLVAIYLGLLLVALKRTVKEMAVNNQ